MQEPIDARGLGDADSPPAGPGPSPSRLRHHREVLVIALVVIALAFALRVDEERVYLSGAPSLPLPTICGSRLFFAMDCPACGLTRAFVHLAQGNWSASLASNRVGWLMALLVIAQVPYRLITVRRGGAEPLGPLIPRLAGYGMIAALIGNWLALVLGY